MRIVNMKTRVLTLRELTGSEAVRTVRVLHGISREFVKIESSFMKTDSIEMWHQTDPANPSFSVVLTRGKTQHTRKTPTLISISCKRTHFHRNSCRKATNTRITIRRVYHFSPLCKLPLRFLDGYGYRAGKSDTPPPDPFFISNY
jgi:hypothetical protein